MIEATLVVQHEGRMYTLGTCQVNPEVLKKIKVESDLPLVEVTACNFRFSNEEQ